MFELQRELSWSQQFAAFWAISWPAWLFTFTALGFIQAPIGLQQLKSHLFLLSVVAAILFFAAQALLVHRLTRKDFRTFRLEVLRGNGETSRKLSAVEGLQVWFWIVWPQLVVMTILSLIVYWLNQVGAEEPGRAISGMSLWIRILAVGPYAIGLALRTPFPGFRIRAYVYKLI